MASLPPLTTGATVTPAHFLGDPAHVDPCFAPPDSRDPGRFLSTVLIVKKDQSADRVDNVNGGML